jgi:protein tyrosine phosphatase
MVYEKKSSLIITLANPIESGREKGHPYWLADGKRAVKSYKLRDESGESGRELEKIDTDLSIQCVKTVTCDSMVTRTLVLSRGMEQHTVTMLHYTEWYTSSTDNAPRPDFGVPDDGEISEIIIASHTLHGDATTPIIVHCSAGVGRTGVFIAADAIVRGGKESKRIDGHDVFGVVEEMRTQRSLMVQV